MHSLEPKGANKCVEHRLRGAGEAFTGPARTRAALAPEHTTAAGLEHAQADAHCRFAVQTVLVLPLFNAASDHIIEFLLTRPFQRTVQPLIVIEQRLFALRAGKNQPSLAAN